MTELNYETAVAADIANMRTRNPRRRQAVDKNMVIPVRLGKFALFVHAWMKDNPRVSRKYLVYDAFLCFFKERHKGQPHMLKLLEELEQG